MKVIPVIRQQSSPLRAISLQQRAVNTVVTKTKEKKNKFITKKLVERIINKLILDNT